MPRVFQPDKKRAALVRARVKAGLERGFQRGEIKCLAEELGVTRQYVSFIKKLLENPEYKPVSKMGRRQRGMFSAKEKAEFIAALRGRPPVKGESRRRGAETFGERLERKRLEKLEQQIKEAESRSTEGLTKKEKQYAAYSLKRKKERLQERLRKIEKAKEAEKLKQEQAPQVLWPPTQACTWFRNRFGRNPRQRQLRLLAEEIGITFGHDDKARQSSLLNWEEIYLDDEFREWQKSPQAIALREREAELARLEAEDRIKNPHLYEVKKRRRGRPKHGEGLLNEPFPIAPARVADSGIAGDSGTPPAASQPLAISQVSGLPNPAPDGLPKPDKSIPRTPDADDFTDDIFDIDGDGMDLQHLSKEQLKAIERSNKETLAKMGAAGLDYPGMEKKMPVRALTPKIGRNDPCPFAPAKKFKRCCGAKGGNYCLKQAEKAE